MPTFRSQSDRNMDKETLQSLMRCPLFNGFTQTSLDELIENVAYKIVDFGKGEIYALEGYPCKYADIILSGEMIARMMGLSGKLIQIDRLTQGAIMAPAFIFAQNNAMPVSVETSEPTRLFRLTPTELKRLIDTYEMIRMNFIRQLSNIDVFLSNKIRVLSLFTVREKVAYFLLKAAERQQSKTIELNMSRQEIADRFGIQKYSLLRCLSEFAESGAIRIDSRKITILDANKLR